MNKKVMYTILVIIAVLILIEISSLLILKRNISDYKKYWDQKANTAGQLTYIALGDSATQGLGASKPQNGYVGIVADSLARSAGKTIRVINLSKTGAVIQDVLDVQLKAIGSTKPDLVTIEIGANDIKSFDEAKFTRQYQELVKRLTKGTYVSNMPYFGSRPKSRPSAFKASEIISRTVKTRPDLKLVDLQTITKDRDSILGYAADYFHPNDRSYKNWADAFLTEINKEY